RGTDGSSTTLVWPASGSLDFFLQPRREYRLEPDRDCERREVRLEDLEPVIEHLVSDRVRIVRVQQEHRRRLPPQLPARTFIRAPRAAVAPAGALQFGQPGWGHDLTARFASLANHTPQPPSA